jgi:hypothetical protein
MRDGRIGRAASSWAMHAERVGTDDRGCAVAPIRRPSHHGADEMPEVRPMTDHDEPRPTSRDDELRPTPLPPAEAMIDEASDESFPASDPPSYPAVSASRSDDHPHPPAADDAERRGEAP